MFDIWGADHLVRAEQELERNNKVVIVQNRDFDGEDAVDVMEWAK